MNSWRSRLALCLLMLLLTWAHRSATADIPNTPAWLLAYHGSAALCDLILLFIVPLMLSSRLADDMQMLCAASILANWIGWLAYMAYFPPGLYNTSILALGLIQGVRLLLTDGDNARSLGVHLVCSPRVVGAQPYFTKAH